MDIKEEVLIAEIERFKEEVMKSYVVSRWAESYTNTDPFGYVILKNENNKVWWLKTQAYQLWEAWLAAKAQAVPEGYVLMPIKPTETMVMAVVKEHEGEAFLPYSLYDAYVRQAMIESQEPAND